MGGVVISEKMPPTTTKGATPSAPTHKDKDPAVDKLSVVTKTMMPPRAPKARQKTAKTQDPPTDLNRFGEIMDLLVERSAAWSEEFNELLLSVEAAHKVISL
jgi:hypothetical protein